MSPEGIEPSSSGFFNMNHNQRDYMQNFRNLKFYPLNYGPNNKHNK